MARRDEGHPRMRGVAAITKVVIAIAFVSWSALFVRASSVEMKDGRRVYCLTDDAMISMRYAENLASGHGLVWNPGDKVEGITNPLWTVLLALPHLVFDRAHTSLAVQSLGVLIALSIALFASRWVGLTLPDIADEIAAAASVAAFVVTLAYYPLVYWTLMGMETGLVTLLLLAAMCLAAGPLATAALASIGALSGLGYLTRPDAITLFGAPCALAIWRSRSSSIPSRKASVLVATPILLAIALQIGFRFAYYGELAPNTYYLKIEGIPLETRLLNGWLFVREFLREHALPIVAAGTGVLLARTAVACSAVVVFLVAVAYQTWAGGDVWLYWRLLAPGGLMALLLGIVFLTHLANRLAVERSAAEPNLLPSQSWRRTIAFGFVLTASLTVVLSADWRFRGEIVFWQRPYQSNFSSDLVPKAYLLREILTADARIAVGGAGILPYFSGLPAVDFLGKNDKKIARQPPDLEGFPKPPMIYFPGHVKSGLNWVHREYQPDFLEYVRFRREALSDEALAEYVQVPGVGFLRRDSPKVRWSDIDLARERFLPARLQVEAVSSPRQPPAR